MRRTCDRTLLYPAQEKYDVLHAVTRRLCSSRPALRRYADVLSHARWLAVILGSLSMSILLHSEELRANRVAGTDMSCMHNLVGTRVVTVHLMRVHLATTHDGGSD